MQNYHYKILFDVIDEIILGVYATEILLKWYCNFTLFWKCGWNIFDVFIVVVMLAGVGKLVNLFWTNIWLSLLFLNGMQHSSVDVEHYMNEMFHSLSACCIVACVTKSLSVAANPRIQHLDCREGEERLP